MGELETEAQNTRGEVAPYRRQLADQLDEGGAVTLELGNQRVELGPADPITFKLEGESDWTEGDTEHRIRAGVAAGSSDRRRGITEYRTDRAVSSPR